ncbi:MAG: sugar transferase [Dehalococcoidia bacterium]|nr:sugar transferase [Dehalococcoidia bacterium]
MTARAALAPRPAVLQVPAVEAEGLTLAELLSDELVPMPAWKRGADVAGALFGILFLAPLFALVSLAVMLDSRGGPFYRQTRVGKGGKLFTCWKFRSMHTGADRLVGQLMEQNEANGHIFKMKDDPRRTRVGVFLRKTSLDELPQLWNVLRGDMSLVGPRPPIPAEVIRYDLPHLQRLVVVPGITGLWQVTLRGHHDFADMVALDLRYARELSPLLDVKILLRTVTTVLTGSGSC